MLSNIDTETYRLLNVEHLRQTEDIQDRTKGIRGVKRRKERGRKKVNLHSRDGAFSKCVT